MESIQTVVQDNLVGWTVSLDSNRGVWWTRPDGHVVDTIDMVLEQGGSISTDAEGDLQSDIIDSVRTDDHQRLLCLLRLDPRWGDEVSSAEGTAVIESSRYDRGAQQYCYTLRLASGAQHDTTLDGEHHLVPELNDGDTVELEWQGEAPVIVDKVAA